MPWLASVEPAARDDDARDAVEIARCVTRSLVFDQLDGAGRREFGHRLRQCGDGARDVDRQRVRRRARVRGDDHVRCDRRFRNDCNGIASARCSGRCLRRRRLRTLVRLRECREACIRAPARTPHGVLARGASDGERAAARQRAEQRSADCARVPAPDRLHVEQHRVLCERARRVDDAAAVETRVAAAHLFACRIHAMRGRDDRRARRRADAAFQHPCGFQQFRADEHVDLPGNGGESEDRRRRTFFRPRELDVVRRRAGALRNTRRRRCLGQQAFGARRVHDPVGQHAAALAAERGDQDRDRLARGRPSR